MRLFNVWLRLVKECLCAFGQECLCVCDCVELCRRIAASQTAELLRVIIGSLKLYHCPLRLMPCFKARCGLVFFYSEFSTRTGMFFVRLCFMNKHCQ